MLKNIETSVFRTFKKTLNYKYLRLCNTTAEEDNSEKEEFRVLSLRTHRKRLLSQDYRKNWENIQIQPRSEKMPTDQDWINVWPATRSFHPASVPLPIRQGYVKKGKTRPIPDKFGNLELMKIPNFLHLSPPAISKQCEALKAFCTPWPEELKDDEECEKYFPVEIITSDYLYAGPSIRDSRARIVTYKVKLSTLSLDDHARDKFIRLAGDCYNKETDILTFIADRCPLKKQNYDYLKYLLTVLHTEAHKIESWESEKSFEDDERFFWHRSPHKKRIVKVVKELKECRPDDDYIGNLSKNVSEEEVLENDVVKEYSEKLAKVIDNGDTVENLDEYKKAVLKLLRMPS